MPKNTHVFNHWPGYSTADCQCCYCLYFPGKKKPCLLEICCCIEEREEALRREQGATNDLAQRKYTSAAAA